MFRQGCCEELLQGQIWGGLVVSRSSLRSIVPQNHMADLMSNIRPKLLGDVIQYGRFHLLSPIPGGLPQAALLRRIIRVGETCFQGIAGHFGPIEVGASRIGFSDDSTGQRIAEAAEKTSVTQRVISWVLVRNGWNNGFGEKSARHAVRKCPPIIATIALDPGA